MNFKEPWKIVDGGGKGNGKKFQMTNLYICDKNAEGFRLKTIADMALRLDVDVLCADKGSLEESCNKLHKREKEARRYAERIILCVNLFAGIKDPAKYLKKLKDKSR